MKERSEKCLIPTSFFTCFFTLVEHVLKLGVPIVPSAYPEHLSAPELGL